MKLLTILSTAVLLAGTTLSLPTAPHQDAATARRGNDWLKHIAADSIPTTPPPAAVRRNSDSSTGTGGHFSGEGLLLTGKKRGNDWLHLAPGPGEATPDGKGATKRSSSATGVMARGTEWAKGFAPDTGGQETQGKGVTRRQ